MSEKTILLDYNQCFFFHKKNYLFCDNDASVYMDAIVYLLIATGKYAKVAFRIWMEGILSKIPYYEKDEKNREEQNAYKYF